MNHLTDICATIAAFTFIGAFVDFYIGKAGQRKVKNALETTWLLFELTSIHNMAIKEAGFAYSIMGKIFGHSVISLKRLGIFLLFPISLFVIGCATTLDDSSGLHYITYFISSANASEWLEILQDGFITVVQLYVSLSLSIFFIRRAAEIFSRSVTINVLIVSALIIVQIGIIAAPDVVSNKISRDGENQTDPVYNFRDEIVRAEASEYANRFISDQTKAAIVADYFVLMPFAAVDIFYGLYLEVTQPIESFKTAGPWQNTCVWLVQQHSVNGFKFYVHI